MSRRAEESSMNRLRLAGVILLVCLTAKPSLPQEAGKGGEPKLLTPEASLDLRTISDLQWSPDGARLAFVVTEPAKGEGRARHIWIYEKRGSGVRQFTNSAKSE